MSSGNGYTREDPNDQSDAEILEKAGSKSGQNWLQ